MRLMMSGFKWSRMRPVNSESRNASCLSVEGSRKENPSRERIIKRLAKKKKKITGIESARCWSGQSRQTNLAANRWFCFARAPSAKLRVRAPLLDFYLYLIRTGKWEPEKEFQKVSGAVHQLGSDGHWSFYKFVILTKQ